LLEDLSAIIIKEIACGYYHTLVLSENGEVFAFGRNDKGQLGIVF